ncbi:MAG TPA: SPOR domain-containing protein [Trueperaceae bacterium]|nr:SPOR domain-containing protein [Trueperaceae bacterium]
MGRSPLRTGLLAVMVATLAGGVGLAQGWSVQTVALRDLRQAAAVVGELRGLGFDAYSEFAMHAGEQFVRVRVGCYTDRTAAQAAADALAGHVTEQAVPVQLASDSQAHDCVQEDIGFLKPTTWKRMDVADGLPTFRVEIGGHQARLIFTGAGWRVLQAGALPAQEAVPPAASFADARPGGVPWVAQEVAAGPRMLCPGKLIGHAGAAAVVERAGEVVACRLVPLRPELARDGAP